MSTISWGIIGCGNVTEKKSGPAFSKVPDSRLVAVMRRDAEKARDYATRHGVPKWYDDASRLINDPEVNAIYIATPPSSHEEYALAAIEAGKSVYVEKPMSLDAMSAATMSAAAEQHGVKLCVAHYRREMPYFRKIKTILEDGLIGKVISAEIRLFQTYDASGFSPSPDNWRLIPAVSGGGIFHDLAPHQLDLMYYFFGTPVQVTGVAYNGQSLYDADDVVAAVARFANDVMFTGTWCFTAPQGHEADTCIIMGAEASLEFGIFRMDRIVLTKNGQQQVMNVEPLEHVQQPMISEVVQYFLGRRDNPCSGTDGVVVMKMIDRIVSNGQW